MKRVVKGSLFRPVYRLRGTFDFNQPPRHSIARVFFNIRSAFVRPFRGW